MWCKKVFIAVLLLLLSGGAVADARLYLGGGFGISGKNDKIRVTIAPDVAFGFTDYFAVGGRLSYESGVNSFGITPYARLNILKEESPVRIIASLEAPFKWASDYSSRGVYLRPGLSVRVAGNVRVEALVGYFGWGSVTSGGSTTSGWQYTAGSNTISLGVVIGL